MVTIPDGHTAEVWESSDPRSYEKSKKSNEHDDLFNQDFFFSLIHFATGLTAVLLFIFLLLLVFK